MTWDVQADSSWSSGAQGRGRMVVRVGLVFVSCQERVGHRLWEGRGQRTCQVRSAGHVVPALERRWREGNKQTPAAAREGGRRLGGGEVLPLPPSRSSSRKPWTPPDGSLQGPLGSYGPPASLANFVSGCVCGRRGQRLALDQGSQRGRCPQPCGWRQPDPESLRT